MNKKEVLEIRRQFSPANCAITRICGCYVTHEKEKKCQSKEAFLSLPEEETFKYFDIFKKTLSGTIGKNLLNLEFPLEQEEAGGTQEFLYRLKQSRLKEEQLLEELYDKIIASYDYSENYYIILIHAAYDIPGQSLDGFEMYDASDNVYDFILCSICPVNLSKAGLCYDAATNQMQERIRDWIVDVPNHGFLFPAFTERAMDLHSVLYYSRKPEEIHPTFLDTLFGTQKILTAGSQKETFQQMITDTIGETYDCGTMLSIHDHLYERISDHREQENPDPLWLGKNEVRHILEESGVERENVQLFEEEYDEMIGATESLLADNIAETKSLKIEAPSISIKIDPQRADLIQTRLIDHRQCLVIPVDDHVEINGVNVRTLPLPKATEESKETEESKTTEESE